MLENEIDMHSPELSMESIYKIYRKNNSSDLSSDDALRILYSASRLKVATDIVNQMSYRGFDSGFSFCELQCLINEIIAQAEHCVYCVSQIRLKKGFEKILSLENFIQEFSMGTSRDDPSSQKWLDFLSSLKHREPNFDYVTSCLASPDKKRVQTAFIVLKILIDKNWLPVQLSSSFGEMINQIIRCIDHDDDGIKTVAKIRFEQILKLKQAYVESFKGDGKNPFEGFPLDILTEKLCCQLFLLDAPASYQSIGRLASTCKFLCEASRKFVLESFIKEASRIISEGGSCTQEWMDFLSSIKHPAPNFDYVTSCLAGAMVNQIIRCIDHDADSIKIEANACFQKILKLKQAYVESLKGDTNPFVGFPLDILSGQIYRQLTLLDAPASHQCIGVSYQSICRLASTCKFLCEVSRNFICEIFINEASKIISEGNSGTQEWMDFLSSIKYPAHLNTILNFDYVTSCLASQDKKCVEIALSILSLLMEVNLLEVQLSSSFGAMVNQIIRCMDHDDFNIHFGANACFQKILKLKQAYVETLKGDVNPFDGYPFDILSQLCSQLCRQDAPVSFQSIGRLASTCKFLYKVSSKLILECFTELRPSVTGSSIRFLSSNMKMQSLAVFIHLIKLTSPNIDALFKYIIFGLGNKNERNQLAALSVLQMLLKENLLGEPFLTFKGDIMQQLSNPNLANNCKNLYFDCLTKMITLKLTTEDAPHCDGIVGQCIVFLQSTCYEDNNKGLKLVLKMLEFGLIRVNLPNFGHMVNQLIAGLGHASPDIKVQVRNILLIMFKKQLLTTKSEYFPIIIEKAASRIARHQSIGIDNFFLRLCQMDQSLRDAILPRFNTAVARAILRELRNPITRKNQQMQGDLMNFIKSIIDSESSHSSQCCKEILAEIQIVLNSYSLDAAAMLIFKEIQHYIDYPLLSIAWDTLSNAVSLKK